MKQKKYFILGGLMIIIVGVFFFLMNKYYQKSGPTAHQPLFNITTSKEVKYLYDTFEIKQEYESLNDTQTSLEEDILFYPKLIITEQAQLQNLDFPALQKMMEEGTGVIYFGFPECPRCRRLLPQLIKASSSANQLVYMFNPKEIRDQILVDESGELVVEKEANAEYQYLLDRLDEFLPVYAGLEDDSIKRLYVPFVLVVKDGAIVGYHNGVLEEYTDPYLSMTLEMKTKLGVILDRLFNATITDETCLPNEDVSC